MLSEDATDFTAEMFKNYRNARTEAGFNSPPLLRELIANGGVETAKGLFNAPHASARYKDLYSKRRLDLTIESMVISTPRWHALFTTEELGNARRRLRDYGFKPRHT